MQTTEGQKANLAWIDNMRVVATIAVIGIHVAAYGVGTEYNLQHRANTNWWISNFYESLFRCCVPLFVMITGALLLPQNIGTGNFLKKRLNRILLPFIFWSLLYIGFKLLLKVRTEGIGYLPQSGRWLMQQILNGAEFHLWYVYMLIGLYLFIPIIQPWIKAASNKTILYFLSIWIITLLLNDLHIIGITTVLDIRYFSGYLGYLILGYYISERMFISNRIRYWAMLLFVAGFVITFFGTYLLSNSYGSFSDFLYDYLTLNVFLLTAGAFVFIKGITTAGNSPIWVKTRSIISKYGYGIYLSHPFLLNFMVHYKLDYKLFTPYVGIPFTSIICLAASCVLVFVINKLPYGKYISG